MSISETIEKIEALAETANIDLDTITRPAYEVISINRKLREATRIHIGDARALAVKATQAPIDQFDETWTAALHKGITAIIAKEIVEAASDALWARSDEIEAKLSWRAIDELTPHIAKLAAELNTLDLHNIGSAEQAIAANAVDDYKRVGELVGQLEEIAALPTIDRRTRPLWVLVAPPALPDAQPDKDGTRLSDEHTPEEQQLIGEAVDIAHAATFREQLLTAAFHGWEITPATSEAEFTRRHRAWHAASHISAGYATRQL